MKKKGFTLIELLAVIIILAVIALIATPVILNVVENARKSAFQSSANGYYDAARYLYDELYLNNARQDLTFTFSDGEQTSSNENYKLQVKGETPKGGIVYLAEDGQIMVSIHNGKYCATTDGTGKVNVSKDIENCVSKISSIPETCFSISNEVLSNNYGDLDGSQSWMEEKYNMLYYNSGEECPKEIDVLLLPNEINGEKVEGISSGAFAGKGLSIKNLILSNNIKVIDTDVFYGCRLKNIILPNSIIYIGALSFTDNQLPDTQAFIYKRNIDGTEDRSTVIGYGGARRDNVIIPNSITSIEFGAFAFNQLINITIPSSVTFIGYGAFEDNQLTSIVIPNGVTTIKEWAFDSNQLTTITIPSSVTSIGDSAFFNNRFPNANAIIIEGNVTRFDSQWTSIGFPEK